MRPARQPSPAQSRPQPTARAELPPRDEIAKLLLADEAQLVAQLAEQASNAEEKSRRIGAIAGQLVRAARANRDKHGGVDAFMHEYGLASEEGVVLMCLAEALLRIPDKDTADALIAEKIGSGRWEQHLGQSDSLFVNASTFGLMLTGRVVRLGEDRRTGPLGIFSRLVARSGEPFIRQALRQAMKILGDNFVLGRTIEEAIARAAPLEARGYRFSYDMLGERAKTATDADRYYERYLTAIETIGKGGLRDVGQISTLLSRPSVSVKLSALHPRFEAGKEERLHAELLPRLIELAAAARRNNLGLTIDAEEQDRLDITLALFGATYLSPELDGWPGLGIAVQAYGKRAMPVLRWLKALADGRKRIPVRLVKGAYWDSEIKWAQERGLEDYPVFTRKVHTDVSYLACARFLFSDQSAFYPQFATHNAQSIAAVFDSGAHRSYELQRLHGMGEALYDEIVGPGKLNAPCRIYAPVGAHADLVAYLVRRLLENGANTSFVNRLADEAAPIEDIIRDPVATVLAERKKPVRRLRRPLEIYAPERWNSRGLALSEASVREPLVEQIGEALKASFLAAPIVDGRSPGERDEDWQPVLCPHDRRERIGMVRAADAGRNRDRPAEREHARRHLGQVRRRLPRPHPGEGRRPLRARPRAADGGASCARPARRSTTPWATCARRSTSCATTQPRRGACSAGPSRCPVRPARPTCSS